MLRLKFNSYVIYKKLLCLSVAKHIKDEQLPGIQSKTQHLLTLKAPITTEVDDNFFYIFFFIFQRKEV